jgi:hypothetical protein
MNTILPLLTLVVSASMSLPIDVTGNWQGTLTLGDKSFPWYLTLKQSGDTCSGTMGPEPANDRRAIQECRIEASTLQFRAPGGDSSGTEFVTVDLQLKDGELAGTLRGKDRTGQIQTFTLSLKPSKDH